MKGGGGGVPFRATNRVNPFGTQVLLATTRIGGAV